MSDQSLLSLLPPRLDQLARLLAAGWSDEQIAAESGLRAGRLTTAYCRLWERLTAGQVPVGREVHRYAAACHLPAERACLHCPPVALLRAAEEPAADWHVRRVMRLCRRCWRRWSEARWR